MNMTRDNVFSIMPKDKAIAKILLFLSINLHDIDKEMLTVREKLQLAVKRLFTK